MSVVHQPSYPVSRPFQWLAVVMALLGMTLGTLASRPDWHKAIHMQLEGVADSDHGHSHDAPIDEEGCAIHLFALGQVDIASFFSPQAVPMDLLVYALIDSDERPARKMLRLAPPGRGPPSAS